MFPAGFSPSFGQVSSCGAARAGSAYGLGPYAHDMPREIGGWLSGPPIGPGDPPGVRLGLPETGPGSVATTGARVGAFLVDAVVANLAAGIPYLFGVRYSLADRNYAVIGAFLVLEFLLDAIYGQTVGKRLFNIRVIRVDGQGLGSPKWLLLRTVLLGFLVPAVVWDRDRRGLHDKAAGVVVVRDPNLAGRPGGQPTAKPPVKRPAAAVASQEASAPGPARQPKKPPSGPPKRKKRR
jgi:uncharacterized RDD family membrane protein YckC